MAENLLLKEAPHPLPGPSVRVTYRHAAKSTAHSENARLVR